jgi:hypothetical protein
LEVKLEDKTDDKEIREIPPLETPNEPAEVNPYAVPASEFQVLPDLATDVNAASPPGVEWVLLWTLLVPAVAANAIFWGYVWLDDLLIGQARLSYGMNLLIFMFIGLPLLAAIYGGLGGWWLYRSTNRQYSFAHPVAQFFFQPFWWVVSVTAGCFAIIPLSQIR